MKGSIIVPRQGRDFEVAHRFEGDEHWLEVSVGASFNELYWDVAARELAASPRRYRNLRKVLTDYGAGWLLDFLPRLASGDAAITLVDIKAMAPVGR